MYVEKERKRVNSFIFRINSFKDATHFFLNRARAIDPRIRKRKTIGASQNAKTLFRVNENLVTRVDIYIHMYERIFTHTRTISRT